MAISTPLAGGGGGFAATKGRTAVSVCARDALARPSELTALLFSLGRAVAAELSLREALVKNQLNAPVLHEYFLLATTYYVVEFYSNTPDAPDGIRLTYQYMYNTIIHVTRKTRRVLICWGFLHFSFYTAFTVRVTYLHEHCPLTIEHCQHTCTMVVITMVSHS